MRRAGGLDRRRRAPAPPRDDQIVEGIIARKKFVYLCTNALLMEKKIDLFEPRPVLHLVGASRRRSGGSRPVGVPGGRLRSRRGGDQARQGRGFRVNINCTLFDGADPERYAPFFDDIMEMGVDGMTVSPGYAYERAPDQAAFPQPAQDQGAVPRIFRRGKGQKWSFSQSSLFLDFLAGNQKYHCTPWGNPTRNYFGWQRPCYLLGEGYAKSFKELMEETDWDEYGTGNYEKCANCMVHSGYEATAVMDSVTSPSRRSPSRSTASPPKAKWRPRSRSKSAPGGICLLGARRAGSRPDQAREADEEGRLTGSGLDRIAGGARGTAAQRRADVPLVRGLSRTSRSFIASSVRR